MKISKIKILSFVFITSPFIGVALNSFFGKVVSEISLSIYYLLSSIILISSTKLKIKITKNSALIILILILLGIYTLFSKEQITLSNYFLSLNSLLISFLMVNEVIHANKVKIFESSIYFINTFLITFSLVSIIRFALQERYLSSYLVFFILPLIPLFIITNWQKDKQNNKKFLFMKLILSINILLGLFNVVRFPFKVPYVLGLFALSLLLFFCLIKISSKKNFSYITFFYPLIISSFIYLIFILYPIFADNDLISAGQLMLDSRHNSLIYRALVPITYIGNNFTNLLILIFGNGLGSSFLRVDISSSKFLQLRAIEWDSSRLTGFAPHDGFYYLFIIFGILGFIYLIKVMWNVWRGGFEIKNNFERRRYFLIFNILSLYFLILNISYPATIPGGYPEALFGFPCLLFSYMSLFRLKDVSKNTKYIDN